jgi:hypothetical protein
MQTHAQAFYSVGLLEAFYLLGWKTSNNLLVEQHAKEAVVM